MTFVDKLLQHATIGGHGYVVVYRAPGCIAAAGAGWWTIFTLLSVLAGCGAVKGEAAYAPASQVNVEPAHLAEVRAKVNVTHGRFDVSMCFPRAGVRSVRLSPKASSRLLRIGWQRASAPALRLNERTGRVTLGAYSAGACLSYEIAVPVRTPGRALLLKRLDWLLSPWPMTETQTLSVELDVRDAQGSALEVATPWPLTDAGTFLVDAQSFRLLTRTVFGEFARHGTRVGDVTLDVVRLPGALQVSDTALLQWLTEAVTALATFSGEAVVRRVQFVVVPVAAGDDPVPFGSVGRGGQPSIMLLVRENAAFERLREHWVAVHELSHLTLPFVKRADAWLSEGTATYYQEVLRARAGLQSELEAWRALFDGFARGRADGTSRSLSEESRDVFETFAFRRVYWSGAALALMFDVALRRGDGDDGPTSLDALLREVSARVEQDGPEARAAFSADAFFGAAERTLRSERLFDLAKPVLDSTSFPALDDVLAFLGVASVEGRVFLNDEAPGASIRRAIMSAE